MSVRPRRRSIHERRRTFIVSIFSYSLLSIIITTFGLVIDSSAANAAAKPIGDCTTSAGVILAVDFSHWGGPILRSCGSTPTTGYELLNQGGWRTAGDNHDGPAFICRIGYSGYHGGTEYPTAKQDPCILTPPASAYWSYWHADPGQNSWSYSQLGAMSYKPKPGSVDLWIFGATNIGGTEGVPTFSPNSVRARNTSPTGGTATKQPAPKPTSAQTTSAPTGQGANPPATDPTATVTSTTTSTAPSCGPALTPPPSPSPSPPPSPSLSPALTSAIARTAVAIVAAVVAQVERELHPPQATTPSPTATSAPGRCASTPTPDPPTSGHPPIENAPPTLAAHTSHGSVAPAVTALVIVLLLAAAGLVAVLRRPRREP
jgi:hypothetical protein